MSVLRWVTGDFRDACRLGQRARDVAASLEDHALRVMSTYYVGIAHHLLGNYREAEDAYLENVRTLTSTSTKEPDPLGTPGSTLVRSAAWLILPLAERGEFREGVVRGRTALDLAEGIQDLYGIVSAAYCLAYLHCLRGERDAAIPLLERGLALCREREFGVWLPQVTGYLGHAYALAGRVEEGLGLLARAIEIFDATGAWPFRTLLTAHRGMAELLAGRVDSARALGGEALALSRQHGERGHEAWALRLLAEIASHHETIDPQQAERHYRDASALADELGMRPLAAHCHLGLGKLYHRTDQREQSREHLATATTMFREMGMTSCLEKAEAEIAG
jgi:tetratricopeptide (TPR) repeat protein